MKSSVFHLRPYPGARQQREQFRRQSVEQALDDAITQFVRFFSWADGLAGRQILVPPMPPLQRRILKRPPVGEADLPRLRAGQPINRVQMHGRETCVLAAGQEYDTRNGGGHVPAQAAQGPRGNLVHRRLSRARLARENHVGLEQHRLEGDILLEQSIEDGVENEASDFLGTPDRMRAIHKHFRLDDRYELLLLTKSGVARERMRALTHAEVGSASVIRMTARHFAKRAPMDRYSDRRFRKPSSPSVTVSSGEPASGFAPVSTLMPGTTP
jgi:hypothetical protein